MDNEQRRQHRIGVSLEVRIRGKNVGGTEFTESTQSTDVSRGGCSFPCTHDVPVGSEMDIEIYRRNTGSFGQAPFLTRGQVMRQYTTDDGAKMIGIRFIGPQFPTYSSEGA